MVLGRAVAAGPRGGALATAGASLGILLWAAAVALGLGALASSSRSSWLAVQWTGAAALVVLGLGGLLRAARPRSGTGAVARVGGSDRSFLPALATSVLNPRAAVTAVSVLPQFVAPGAPAAATTLVLGAVWAGLAAAWNLVGVALATRGRRFLRRPAAHRAVEAAGGCFMVATAVAVVLAV